MDIWQLCTVKYNYVILYVSYIGVGRTLFWIRMLSFILNVLTITITISYIAHLICTVLEFLKQKQEILFCNVCSAKEKEGRTHM